MSKCRVENESYILSEKEEGNSVAYISGKSSSMVGGCGYAEQQSQ